MRLASYYQSINSFYSFLKFWFFFIPKELKKIKRNSKNKIKKKSKNKIKGPNQKRTKFPVRTLLIDFFFNHLPTFLTSVSLDFKFKKLPLREIGNFSDWCLLIGNDWLKKRQKVYKIPQTFFFFFLCFDFLIF